MRTHSILGGAFAAAVALAALPALAAPQVLAVMSSLGPLQMRCDGSVCTSTFSSYCLQRERDVPVTGQVYLPATPQKFDLIVIAEDGSEKRVPAADHVTFRSERGYSSVRVNLARSRLADLGGVSAKITVTDGAALVPEPVAGDPNPISEAEMAFVTRSLREHGDEIVDATPEAQGAAIVNRLAATIVPKMPASRESIDQLWHDVIDGLGPAQPAAKEGIKRARDIYNWCQGRMSYHSMGGIKSCLEFKHDDTIMRLNRDYWKSQPGY